MVKQKICAKCGSEFPIYIMKRGARKTLNNRKYCLDCSPWGKHNTKRLHSYENNRRCILCDTKLEGQQKLFCRIKCKALYYYRQRRDNESKELRRVINLKKAIQHLGGRCQKCKQTYQPATYDFHHEQDKEWGISRIISRSWERLKIELYKCTLLCANCHQELHDNNNTKRSQAGDYLYERRTKFKAKAVEYKGDKCESCGYKECLRALSFHHIDPKLRKFAIGGLYKMTQEIKDELDRCSLLCENCHRAHHS